MASKQRILIVDDDENIAELISLYLTKECYETKIVYDGESALSEIPVFKPNLILLDLMLPGMDGYQVCREVRKNNNVPIIMLSAKGETFDKVLGLELGADDYIIKPFSMPLVLRRIEAVLRRTEQGIEEDPSVIRYKEITLDTENYEVLVGTDEVSLTSREFEILKLLLENPGKVFSRESLLDSVWGYEYYGDQKIVNTHIKNIRKKLGVDYIETIRGVGYRIEKENQ